MSRNTNGMAIGSCWGANIVARCPNNTYKEKDDHWSSKVKHLEETILNREKREGSVNKRICSLNKIIKWGDV